MMDDSKQARDSYDATHRMEQLDAFTEQTIASVDEYLRGEREAEERGLESPCAGCGYMPQACTCDPLCWRCGQPESEHYGLSPSYCDPWDEDYGGRDEKRVFQGEPWDAEATDASGWTQAEKDAYSAALDDEYDEYWSHHCVKHHDALRDDGSCVQCEAELADERISDL